MGQHLSIDKHTTSLDDLLMISPSCFKKVNLDNIVSQTITQNLKIWKFAEKQARKSWQTMFHCTIWSRPGFYFRPSRRTSCCSCIAQTPKKRTTSCRFHIRSVDSSKVPTTWRREALPARFLPTEADLQSSRLTASCCQSENTKTHTNTETSSTCCLYGTAKKPTRCSKRRRSRRVSNSTLCSTRLQTRCCRLYSMEESSEAPDCNEAKSLCSTRPALNKKTTTETTTRTPLTPSKSLRRSRLYTCFSGSCLTLISKSWGTRTRDTLHKSQWSSRRCTRSSESISFRQTTIRVITIDFTTTRPGSSGSTTNLQTLQITQSILCVLLMNHSCLTPRSVISVLNIYS